MTHKRTFSIPKIALYEPDIPQNTAAIIRTCSCLGAILEIIEPCGFLFNDKRFKRVVMDYFDESMIKIYKSADEFFNTTYGESEYVKAMEIESTEKLSNIKNAMQSITDKNGINARGMHWEIPTAVVPATPANPTTSANPTTPSAPAN